MQSSDGLASMSFRSRVSASRLLEYAVYFSLSLHWLTALWLYIMTIEVRAGVKLEHNWFYTMGLVDEAGHRTMSRSSDYLLAFFTITTYCFGIGSITATTALQQVMGLVYVMLGAMITGTLFASIISLVTTMDKSSADFWQKMQEVNQVMSDVNGS